MAIGKYNGSDIWPHLITIPNISLGILISNFTYGMNMLVSL